MDDNRIKPVSPSPARLKYDSSRNKNSGKKKKKRELTDSSKSTVNDGKVIDDFA